MWSIATGVSWQAGQAPGIWDLSNGRGSASHGAPTETVVTITPATRGDRGPVQGASRVITAAARLPLGDAWIAWMKSFAFPDQQAVDWFGLWQKEQVGPLLRWPAWKVGAAPSSTWHVRQFLLSTMVWRPV